MESSKDLNTDAAAFESKESSSSIFGFSPIDEALEAPKDDGTPTNPDSATKPG